MDFLRVNPLVLIVALIVWLVSLGGCVSETDRNILLLQETVNPILEKALSEVQLDSAQFSANAQAINPKYKGTISGLWVTGVIGEVTFGFDGVSGQLAGATQGRGQGPSND